MVIVVAAIVIIVQVKDKTLTVVNDIQGIPSQKVKANCQVLHEIACSRCHSLGSSSNLQLYIVHSICRISRPLQ